jgi:histone H3/H4
MAAYARAVAKVAAAQIAESAGYEGIQASANDTLAELMLRYIVELGSAAHAYAEVAGRTGINASDLARPVCTPAGRAAVTYAACVAGLRVDFINASAACNHAYNPVLPAPGG